MRNNTSRLGVAAMVVVVVVGALAMAACSGGGSADVATLPAVTTVATPAVLDSAVSSPAAAAPAPATTLVVTTVENEEGEPTTSVPPPVPTESTPSTAVPTGFVGLSADGPWKLVDSAPGVDSPGLVYELMPKLWAFLPTVEVPDDGNLFVPQPQDIPIIEAYLQSRLVFYRATVARPMLLEDAGWAEWFVDGGNRYRQVLEPRDADGQHNDLDVGVVLRPYVIGENRSEAYAIVFDCALDGAVWRMPDGSLGPGSTAGVVLNGLEVVMTAEDSHWMANTSAHQELACV